MKAMLKSAALTAALALNGCSGAPPKDPATATPSFKADKALTPEQIKTQVVDGNNEFACQIYGLLAKKEGNLFLSPFSISTALGMTYAGSRGDTAKEIATAMHFKGPDINSSLSALQSAFNEPNSNYQLSVSNRVWPAIGFTLQTDYQYVLQTKYQSSAEALDFSASDTARTMINQWVAHETHDKILDLIPSGVLSEATRMVLTNAIYFKGTWQFAFRSEATREAAWTDSANHPSRCQLMQLQGHLAYGKVNGVQVLSLPYSGNRISMIVLLPEKPADLGNLERDFDLAHWQSYLADLKPTLVQLSLPRFKVTAELELAPTLQSLGMNKAFGRGADFSGIGGKPGDLYISNVIHKAFVDVNEKGTEAAAATAVLMTTKSVGGPDEEELVRFQADHPFLYAIRDDKTGSILFLGRLEQPPQ